MENLFALGLHFALFSKLYFVEGVGTVFKILKLFLCYIYELPGDICKRKFINWNNIILLNPQNRTCEVVSSDHISLRWLTLRNSCPNLRNWLTREKVD